MPVGQIYNLYSPYIISNIYQKVYFWPFRQLTKRLYFINTKKYCQKSWKRWKDIFM